LTFGNAPEIIGVRINKQADRFAGSAAHGENEAMNGSDIIDAIS
jgi:hypothetical protein